MILLFVCFWLVGGDSIASMHIGMLSAKRLVNEDYKIIKTFKDMAEIKNLDRLDSFL